MKGKKEKEREDKTFFYLRKHYSSSRAQVRTEANYFLKIVRLYLDFLINTQMTLSHKMITYHV